MSVVWADRSEIGSEHSPGQRAWERARVDGRFLARGKDRIRLQGVTYGPFAPDESHQPFPHPQRIRRDFEQMRAIGINAVRTYYMPPDSFLDMADEQEMSVLIDIPWAKHLCFLESEEAKRQARHLVYAAAERGQHHPCVLAYSIGNEIPANVVRWHGARRVERFLMELTDVVRQADSEGLVTYANYPSTEYLDLAFLDFATFNVYLHDREAFRRYLFRLLNRVGDRPLVLGEIGMDTYRQGETEQAEFLAGHLQEATLMGLAGAFVFAWTDDWYTGGHQIEDWAFGITDADRNPKPAYYALRGVFQTPPPRLLDETPRVSVVVCSYNGAATLAQCLRSLSELIYPDYEVILVDDGSTDDTFVIASAYPSVRYIHQSNQGLSAARNVGLQASTGAIVAYTDSDCFADPHWLTHLVYQLQQTGAAAVGGPNLTPDDGWLSACVAASPGQPTHVLENDQIAEHIPGCNMAFRREVLEALHGFVDRYRKAGDDVDLCWRLQQAGQWITFAPGAFVWHHRRQDPGSYLRQQAGYGEAEGLLWFDHPDRFNSRGEGKWQGTLYGASRAGLQIGRAAIYRGIFGTGLFQTLYQPGAAHWASLPGTLEWHVAAVCLGLTALLWSPAWIGFAGMLLLSVAVAAVKALQAPLAPAYRGLCSRLLVLGLSYVQPLVRSWWRYRTRLFPPANAQTVAEALPSSGPRLPLSGRKRVEYWSETWRDRVELLESVVCRLNDLPWATRLDSGWADWDMEIHCHPWTALQILTAQEDHGSGKRLIRLRYRLRPGGYLKVLSIFCCLAVLIGAGVSASCAVACLAASLMILLAVWQRGTVLSAQVLRVVDNVARQLDMTLCLPRARGRKTSGSSETISEQRA